MSESLLRRNIIILPDTETARFAIELSKMVARNFSTRFTLHDKDAIPHVTITNITFPSRRQKHLSQQIKMLTHSHLPIEISMGKASIFQDVLFWDVLLTKSLYQLHKSVVKTANLIREGYYHSGDESWAPKNTPFRENLIKYGYPLTHELFIPHITLTEIADAAQYEDAVDFVNEKLGSKQRGFGVNSLAAGSAGRYGTCPKILTIYKHSTK